MFKYIVKKNGFDLFCSTGKKSAVQKIERHIDFEGSTEDRFWTTKTGIISCKAGNDIFTIDKRD